MPYKWPLDTDFILWELDVLDRARPAYGRIMYICDHRYRRIVHVQAPIRPLYRRPRGLEEMYR